jgi:cell division cycle protein 20 (cofactor of APC complex)
MDMDISQFLMENRPPPSPTKEGYREKLAQSLFDGKLNAGSKVLAFRAKAPSPKKQTVLYSTSQQAKPVAKTSRYIPQNAEKILDAPETVDDFYLNLLDWSSQNVVAISLGNTVYLWDAATGGIKELVKTETPSNIITSVSWTKDGGHLAVGTDDGIVSLWDVNEGRALRQLRGTFPFPFPFFFSSFFFCF